MSDKILSRNDEENTLITLDQLSQTLEVMTGVVNRLKRHLVKQLLLKEEILEEEPRLEERELTIEKKAPPILPQDSLVIEIAHKEFEQEIRDDRTIH